MSKAEAITDAKALERAAESPTETHSSRKLTLETDDGVSIICEHFEAENPDAMIVFVHGFSAHRNHKEFLKLTNRLKREDFSFVTFDSRGHGESTGKVAFGVKEWVDIKAVVDSIENKKLPLILVGISMGAASILKYAKSENASKKLAGVILINCPAEWKVRFGLLGIYMGFVSRTRLGRWFLKRRTGIEFELPIRFPELPKRMIRQLKFPVAIVVGAKDRLFGLGSAYRLYRNANKPKRLEIAPGGGHGSGSGLKDAVERAKDWLLERLDLAPDPDD